MTPPDAPEGQADATPEVLQPAVLSCPEDGAAPCETRLATLTKRSDFLRAARARRQGASSFLLQARRRGSEEPAAGIRVGYTCSKKVGNAVARNRAKRRLREIARKLLPELGHVGWDYVLIGKRHDTAVRPFEMLQKDLIRALERIHADKPSGKPRRQAHSGRQAHAKGGRP